MKPQKQATPDYLDGRHKNTSQKQNRGIITLIKKIIAFIFLLLLISGAGIIGGIYYFQHFITTPADSTRAPHDAEYQQQDPKPIGENENDAGANPDLFTIQSGESLQQTARRLEQAGIIKNRYLFRLLAMTRGVATKIQAGEYLLSASHSPEVVLNRLVTGRVKLHKLTVPEGLTIKEIARLVEQAGFGSQSTFIRLANDRSVLLTSGIMRYFHPDKTSKTDEKPNSKAQPTQAKQAPGTLPDSLEGYLFPDTYFFPARTTQKEIIKSMIKRFHQVFTPQWQERCRAGGFTPHEMVILASIIEKETGAAHERPLISSVFHNRLKKRMRLQSDPTVIYGIPNFNGNLTRKDLKRTTPYNTYAIKGLPLGPIANPGRLSLEAALFPEQSRFIYFVSKNDRTHYFSKTLKEHNRAVRKYQLGNKQR